MIKYVNIEDALNAFGLSEKTRKYGGDRSGYDTRMLYEIQGTLESLPVADVVERPKWIPCAERLPEIGEWVLCQCRGNQMDVFCLTEDEAWEQIYPRTFYWGSFVIAWMPLPEPYKEKHNG